jgi:hypothetical protein
MPQVFSSHSGMQNLFRLSWHQRRSSPVGRRGEPQLKCAPLERGWCVGWNNGKLPARPARGSVSAIHGISSRFVQMLTLHTFADVFDLVYWNGFMNSQPVDAACLWPVRRGGVAHSCQRRMAATSYRSGSRQMVPACRTNHFQAIPQRFGLH